MPYFIIETRVRIEPKHISHDGLYVHVYGLYVKYDGICSYEDNTNTIELFHFGRGFHKVYTLIPQCNC